MASSTAPANLFPGASWPMPWPRSALLESSTIVIQRKSTSPQRGESQMIIDCHGHYTSEPAAFIEFRKQQVAAFTDSSKAPAPPNISDDQIRERLEQAQLKFQKERGTDVTIFSPRASAMGHHVGDANLSLA